MNVRFRLIDRRSDFLEGHMIPISRRENSMKNFMIVMVAALSLTAVAGCKKKSGMGEAMAKMGEFKDKMCACKDTACAQKVSDEMTKWSQEQAKDQKEPPKMSEEDTKKATAIGEEMGKCM